MKNKANNVHYVTFDIIHSVYVLTFMNELLQELRNDWKKRSGHTQIFGKVSTYMVAFDNDKISEHEVQDYFKKLMR